MLAARLPEPTHTGDSVDDGDEPGYLNTLRVGLAEAAARPGVRAAVLAVALVGGFDAVEEYFPLITEDSGIPTAAVPLAMLPIGLAGALGAALGGHAARWYPVRIAALFAAGSALLGVAGLAGHPAGLAAVVLFYGGYGAVHVVVDARLQDRIASRSRATVTSVAGLGIEVATFGIYAAWAIGEVTAVAALGVALAALPACCGSRPQPSARVAGRARARYPRHRSPGQRPRYLIRRPDQPSRLDDLRRRRHVGQQVGRPRSARRVAVAPRSVLGRPGRPYIRRAHRGRVAKAIVATVEKTSLRVVVAAAPVGANMPPTPRRASSVSLSSGRTRSR